MKQRRCVRGGIGEGQGNPLLLTLDVQLPGVLPCPIGFRLLGHEVDHRIPLGEAVDQRDVSRRRNPASKGHHDLDTPGRQFSGDPERLGIPQAFAVGWGQLELRVEHRLRGLVDAFEVCPEFPHPEVASLRLVQVGAEVEGLLDSLATIILPANHAPIASPTIGLPLVRVLTAGHTSASKWDMEVLGAFAPS